MEYLKQYRTVRKIPISIYLPESPSWLWARSNYRKASRNLSIITNREDDFKIEDKNNEIFMDEIKTPIVEKKDEGYLDMIKSFYCVKTMIIMGYCFPTCSLMYYGWDLKF